MIRFLARRLLSGTAVLAVVSVATFFFAEVAPGDFLSEMRLDPRISAETLASLESRFGLDQPLPVRYWRWLRSIFSGELGHSFAYNVPVGSLLWPRARNTLLLTTVAMVLAWAIAIPLATWTAWQRAAAIRHRTRWGGLWSRWLDHLLQGAAALPLALPDIVLGLGCLFIAAKTGLFPTGGMVSLDFASLSLREKALDLAWHLTLPAGALAVGQIPVLFRHTRAALADALETPSLHAARGHGVPRRRLLFHYALPSAAPPLANLLGLSVARLLSGSLLIEIILGWPGVGPLLLEAIQARDLHVVVGATLMSCVFLIAGSLVADLLLLFADPRIRIEETAR